MAVNRESPLVCQCDLVFRIEGIQCKKPYKKHVSTYIQTLYLHIDLIAFMKVSTDII